MEKNPKPKTKDKQTVCRTVCAGVQNTDGSSVAIPVSRACWPLNIPNQQKLWKL